jgi:hypothetical protein
VSSFGDEIERAGLRHDVQELQWKKENLERQFEQAGRRWEALMAFLKKIGIEHPSDFPDTLEELPF